MTYRHSLLQKLLYTNLLNTGLRGRKHDGISEGQAGLHRRLQKKEQWIDELTQDLI